MANRYPLILDTDDNNRLKELPSGDSLNLTGNAIVGVGNISSIGSLSISNITAAGNISSAGTITSQGAITSAGEVTATGFNIGADSVLELVDYTNLLNIPTFAPVATSNSYVDLANKPNIPTDLSQLTDGNNLLDPRSTFTSLADTPDIYTGFAGYAVVVNETNNGLTFIAGATVTSDSIITALGYTPYNATTNSAGFINSAFGITDTLGYTPYNATTNSAGFINSAFDIANTLGYTPYDGATNPNNYLTSELQTLDNVVNNGSTTATAISVGGLTTTGTINTGTINISGELVLTSTGTITIDGGVGSILALGGTSNLSLRDQSGSIDLQASLIPNVNSAYDLGTTSLRFNNGYFTSTVSSADFASTAAAAVFTLAGSMLFQPTATGRVGISQGVFKLPVITTVQRNAITAQDGDIIFNNTSFIPEVRQNSQWRPVMPVAGPEPTNPWPGMIAIADGSSWNPASGNEALMCYLNGAWQVVAQGA
jgi:hypothetical protein